MAGDDVIELKEVVVNSQEYEILGGISTGFRPHRSTLIMGPSGCGKSTLLKVAAGIVPPDRGRVLFEGEDLFRLSERKMLHFRKENGFVFQDAALWANKTVYENLALPLQYHRPELATREVNERVYALLGMFTLQSSAAIRPAQLSHGERKLVSFLRAIALEPRLLFLDEPTLSIDFEMQQKMLNMIKELKERGCTIIAVTHHSYLTSMIADDLVVMKAGKLLEAGPFAQVRRSPNPEVAAVLSQVLTEAASYDADLLDLLGH